jgi:hypothetical protein
MIKEPARSLARYGRAPDTLLAGRLLAVKAVSKSIPGPEAHRDCRQSRGPPRGSVRRTAHQHPAGVGAPSVIYFASDLKNAIYKVVKK